MTALTITATIEHWPLAKSFRISRGAKTEASVVVATISDSTHSGRGECVPYARYEETVDEVKDTVTRTQRTIDLHVEDPFDRHKLLDHLPAGAARNAIDCALWDLEAKRKCTSAANLAGLKALTPQTTAYTISLDTPENMAQDAAESSNHPLLKLKLGGDGDDARLRAVRSAVPNARLIVDANEAWTPRNIEQYLSVAKDAGVELIEQPLPAGQDEHLGRIDRFVPICADESVHDRSDLGRVVEFYDAVNIKLDKSGGLTEALAMSEAAKALDLKIMIGCMVGTSLGAAPAMLLAQNADWVDLDGPLLLKNDRKPGLKTDGAIIHPPTSDVWG